jgi:hypothetical protein
MEGVQEIHSLAKYPEPPFLPGSFLGLRLLLLFECIRTALSCPKCSDGNPLFCISSGGSSQSYRGNLWPWMRQVSSAGLDYVGLKWTESLKARAWLVSKSMSFLRRTVSSQVGIFCGFARCGNCGRSQAILDRTPFRPFITCRSIPQRSIYLPSLSQHCLGTDGQELLASIYNYNYIVIYT